MISRKIWTTDGEVFKFLSEFVIRGEQYCRPFAYVHDVTLATDGSEDVLQDPNSPWNFPYNLYRRGPNNPTDVEDLISTEDWDLVNNYISVYEVPPSGVQIYLEVATTPEEFGSTIALPSVARAEEAADRADTAEAGASQSAANALLAEWVSTAESMTAESYAIEPYRVNVKEYESNGDGTYTATEQIDVFSALSHATDAGNIVSSGGMNWKNAWNPGEYILNDTVRDGLWTMVANKVTSERPAPESLGDPTYLVPELPSWTNVNGANTKYYGYDFTPDIRWVLSNLRVWVGSTGNDYVINLYDMVDGLNPKSIYEHIEPLGSATGWLELSTSISRLLTVGNPYKLEVKVANAGAPTVVPYVYELDGLLDYPTITVKGYVSDTELDPTPTLDDNYYGIDIKVEQFTVSPDWDLLAESATGGSVEGGSGGVSSFDALLDTPSDKVGMAGRHLRVKSTEDGLEYLPPESATASIIGGITAYYDITSGTLFLRNDGQDATPTP